MHTRRSALPEPSTWRLTVPLVTADVIKDVFTAEEKRR
jgi:hypothetical protein